MFQLLADESLWDSVRRRARGLGLGLTFQVFLMLALLGQTWLAAHFSTSSAADEPPAPAMRDVLTILAPPPGELLRVKSLAFRSGGKEATTPGAAVKLDESAEISFDADQSRQLVPVLTAFEGLIVFVPLLDRGHPRAAFRPDGSPAAVPSTLDHWVRIRLANPSWWPEVEALCSAADANGEMEAVAVFPPNYRAKLGAAIQARMAELKSSGRVVGVGLRLEAGRPAGVEIRAIRLAPPGQFS